MTNQPTNADLIRLHRQLLQTNDQLTKRLATVTDATLAKAIVTEMREVVHRIDIVQGQLFAKVTAKLTKAVDDVAAVNKQVESDIAKLTRVVDFVKSVSKFLGLVDKAIDLAKAF